MSINVSEAIVPFRETIIEPPKTDMVNEAIEGENIVVRNKDKDPGEKFISIILKAENHSKAMDFTDCVAIYHITLSNFFSLNFKL